MATERIRVDISRDDLDKYLDDLSKVRTGTEETESGLPGIRKEVNKIRREAAASGLNLDELPALNRELRIIGRLIPGFTRGSSLYFQLRRQVRGQMGTRSADALREQLSDPKFIQDLMTETGETENVIRNFIEKQITADLMKGALAKIVIVAVIIQFIVKTIRQVEKKIERERAQFENEIRRDTELTHRQFRELQAEQIGFATWVDQFEAEWDEEGFVNTAVKTVINRLQAQGYILPKGGKYTAASQVDPWQ